MKSLKIKQAGFTLVEMAIVILIIGLIIGATFAYLGVQVEARHEQVTRDKQKKIASALTNYVQSQGRLPCPGAALPAGTLQLGDPVNATALAPWGVCSFVTERDGIVPFRVLGLTQEDATDSYGNPFTYAVDTHAAKQTVPTLAHANCRVQLKWVPLVPPNINGPKALFCCPPVTAASALNQLIVYTDTNKALPANRLTPVHEPYNALTYLSPDVFASTGITPSTLGYTAYVLVSHGQNASNAYIFGQSARRVTPNIGTGETENSNNDREFMALPRSTVTGNAYFDDIVLTRTQEAMMRELNNDSCAIP